LVLDSDDRDGLVVRFTVTDTGVGIPQDRLDRLFKAFSQADASTTRTYGGTGLGLAISKRLSELMGGTIGVESEAGQGSTFWFTVRFEKVTRPGLAAEPPRVNPRSFRVLVVDDNDIHREVLGEQIASWGLEGHTVRDADGALGALAEAAAAGSPFHLAIIDADMPGMDGYQLGEAIRSIPALHDTGLLVLLAVDAFADLDRLRAFGFAGSISKPVRQSKLFDTIMSAVAANGPHATAMVQLEDDAPTRERFEHARQFKGMRVLVAEDHEINQMVVLEVLTQSGFECDMVSNGKAAVEAALTGRYDLVLMDCQMPLMDGFDATRVIRAAEASRGSHIPIIALTANAMKGDREACLQAGMDAYTSKPIEPEHLLTTMTSLLEARGCVRRAA
jgi:CheY-like chemotaxis protein